MIKVSNYNSPIGNLLIAVENDKLIGLWIEGQKYYKQNIEEDFIISDNDPMIIKTKNWLDKYFNNEKPKINELDLDPTGSDFRKNVWKIITEIPYGSTVTYKDIAQKIATTKKLKKMSAQAVGGAVSHNPISIIIPCHRVVGINGITGYAGGLDKKTYLLNHENANMKTLFIHSKETSL